MFVCLFVDAFSRDGLTMRISNKKKPKTADIPSGLVSNWKSKLSAAAPLAHLSQTSSKVEANTSVETACPLGGLQDEDAFANVSGTLALSKERPTGSRKNDVRCFHV
jgi:hypothetical protein